MIIASDSVWYLLFFRCWTLLILRRVLYCSYPTPVCAWMSFTVENDYFLVLQLHKVHLKYKVITYCVVCEASIFSTVLCKIPVSSFPWEPSICKLQIEPSICKTDWFSLLWVLPGLQPDALTFCVLSAQLWVEDTLFSLPFCQSLALRIIFWFDMNWEGISIG